MPWVTRTVDSVTQGVQDSLAPWGEPGSDWQNYNATLSAMFEQVFQIVADQGTPDDAANYQAGWSILLDPQRCPTEFLPYLGMFVGVYVPPGTEDGTARGLITGEAGFNRGTLQAIQAAIERAQDTPDRSKYAVVERTSLLGADAYHFLVVIDPRSLVTQGDGTQLKQFIDAIRPAGVRFDAVLATSPLLSQYTRLLSGITRPLNAVTLADVV